MIPALAALSAAFQRDLNTRAARQILVVTAGVESGMGHYVRQLGNGPALNIYQMEKWVYEDDFKRVTEWIERKQLDIPEYEVLVEQYAVAEWTIRDNFAATVAARLHYWLVPHALPEAGNVEKIWLYYKSYWNSVLGDTDRGEFQKAWDTWHVAAVE